MVKRVTGAADASKAPRAKSSQRRLNRIRLALALRPLPCSRSSSSSTDWISRRMSVISASPAVSSRASCPISSAPRGASAPRGVTPASRRALAKLCTRAARWRRSSNTSNLLRNFRTRCRRSDAVLMERMLLLAGAGRKRTRVPHQAPG